MAWLKISETKTTFLIQISTTVRAARENDQSEGLEASMPTVNVCVCARAHVCVCVSVHMCVCKHRYVPGNLSLHLSQNAAGAIQGLTC